MNKTEGKNLHKGHRKRMKDKCLKFGIEHFEDHEILEMLLFFAIPYRDTNPTAHLLINEFGSLYKVLDADFDDLTKIKGVKEGSATFIKLISDIYKTYITGRVIPEPISISDVPSIVLDKYDELNNPHFMLVLLNSRPNILFCDMLFKEPSGDYTEAIREVVKYSINYSAKYVIYVSFCESGNVQISEDTIEFTHKLEKVINNIGMKLLDHLIFFDRKYLPIIGYFKS